MSPLWVWSTEFESGDEARLSAEESKHVVSRRLREGDSLVIFDGVGRSAPAAFVRLERRIAIIRVGEVETASRTRVGFSIASAIPTPARLSTMLQMISQLGLASWQPLILEYSSIRKFDPEVPRMQRIALESCKVARRPWVMEMSAPLTLADWLGQRDAETPLYFGDRDGEQLKSSRREGCIVVGPEAGFTEDERDGLHGAAATPIRLGPFNLRIETAAVAAVSAFNVLGGGANGER